MKYYVLFIFIYSFVFASVTTKSIISPRSLSLGSALVGNIGANETIFENPASIAFTKSYTVEGGFHNNQRDKADLFNFSVVDSRTSKASGSFAYSRINEKIGSSHNLFYLSLAERYWENVSVGIGAKYVKSNIEEKKSTFYDFDFGFLFAFSKYIGFGVTMRNIKKSNDAFSPQEISMGIQAAFSYFYPTFNVIQQTRYGFSDISHLIYAIGLEVVAMNQFFTRFGYNINNSSETRSYALGLGWNAPKISFDYAFQKEIRTTNGYQHIASIRFFF